MTPKTENPPIILIAGHWLGAWAWDEVLDHLDTTQLHALAITLPGLESEDPQRAAATLDDQAAAIQDVMTQAGASRERPAVIVAHSGANAPVSLVLDRAPELIRRVVWVDSGPVAPGSSFAPDLPESVTELPLSPFDALAEQASLEGLSAEVLERFRARAVPEPAPVLRESVTLSNEARRRIPHHVGVLLAPGRAGPGAVPHRTPHVRRGHDARGPRRRRSSDGALAHVEPSPRSRRGHREGGFADPRGCPHGLKRVS